MGNKKRVPSFRGLRPSSNASSAAKKANRSEGLKSERLLRERLVKDGLRFRTNVKSIEGKPDIVFEKERIAVFCDGDYWHGRNWRQLCGKLEKRWNSEYWIKKISSNRKRDNQINRHLSKEGWGVLRYWETDILNDVISIAEQIKRAISLNRKVGK